MKVEVRTNPFGLIIRPENEYERIFINEVMKIQNVEGSCNITALLRADGAIELASKSYSSKNDD